jgi:hypothetical protein
MSAFSTISQVLKRILFKLIINCSSIFWFSFMKQLIDFGFESLKDPAIILPILIMFALYASIILMSKNGL